METESNHLKAANALLEKELQQKDLHIKRMERELQVEAALEKIRARTMTMRQSSELNQVVAVVYEQASSLGFSDWGSTIMIFHTEQASIESWVSALSKDVFPTSYLIKGIEHPVIQQHWDVWKNKVPRSSISLKDREKESYDRYLFAHTDFRHLPEEMKEGNLKEKEVHVSFAYMQYGLIAAVDSQAPLSDENFSILQRIANVFEQTYTRFLDLQKAEAQAREAEIETSLEKIRSASMAMHTSAELPDVALVLVNQLFRLEINQLGSSIFVPSDDQSHYNQYSAHINLEGQEMTLNLVQNIEFPHIFLDREIFRLANSGEKDYSITLRGEELREWMVFTRDNVHRERGEAMLKAGFECIHFHFAIFHGVSSIVITTLTPLPESDRIILRRMADAFGMSYTRFLDLQKAEAQAREAQIEAALERVRSRTMAMQKSEELPEVAQVVFEQFNPMNLDVVHSWVTILLESNEFGSIWSTEFGGYSSHPKKINLPLGHPAIQAKYDQWKKGDPFLNYHFEGDEVSIWMDNFNVAIQDSFYPTENRPDYLEHMSVNHWWGEMSIATTKVMTQEAKDIIARFARVFDQSFTRFLDLKKAEAQAREAQIEASLERVRGRTMAMHKSDELTETASQIFKELESLGIRPWTFGFNIWVANEPITEAWSSSGSSEIMWRMTVPHTIDPTLIEIFRNKDREIPLLITKLEGDDLEKHIGYMMLLAGLKELSKDIENIGIPDVFYLHTAYFRYGYLLFVTNKPIPEAESLFVRFAKVFEQTYTRFLDLKNAEARAKEAVRQASLDRVRAEIASMRSAEDLERITPLFWQELTILGVPFFRCGVFIVDEATETVHSYFSTPEGHSLAVMDLPFETSETTSQVVKHWKKNKVFKEHWDRQQFVDWTQSMVAQHRLTNPDEYQDSPTPPESLFLNFVPFKQGMLYIGNSSELSEDEIDLVQSLASAFTIAYARYEDFKQLEEAKTKVEATLDELKSTQTQLIQSEKMASLGELTAGIAHEIQNPLNFVNNYSEVSRELIEELLQDGNVKIAEQDIIQDLDDNLAKIYHHGKRAEAIVRGMLLHSRKNSGTREPTDLNTLVYEYFRLAYQGMRAKDESFEAECLTDFDPNLPLLEVAPSEIGRALLNIINNAFQAIQERSNQGEIGYIPTVKITTVNHPLLEGEGWGGRRYGEVKIGEVQITISDNGPGIPEAIKDKIFQPFFTTRPTGQGTGLGLSLAYDIVKAHGGELTVHSEVPVGTEITITLTP